MCSCNGKPVRYLIYKRNTLLATCNNEEEALQAAKEVRGYVCVDVTSDVYTNVDLIRPKAMEEVA